jgi:protein ImuB
MFACLYADDFPVQASLLAERAEVREALKQSPLAVLDGPANLPRVFATNSAARRAGIRIGMTKLQVETYGGVLLRKRIVEAEDVAQNTLVEFAGGFSPRVESTCAGAVILDLAGTGKLFGSPNNVAHTMTTKAAAIGFELRVAIAANPDTAFHAARGFSSITIIPGGDGARRLAPLHVSVLPISPEMLEVLYRWGIHTFQSLAALPSVAVVERLGQEGLYLQKLARGEIDRPLLTAEAAAEFVESFEFDDPVETLESLFFILNRLLQKLCSHLIAVSLAANELRLTVGFEVRQIQSRTTGDTEDHRDSVPSVFLCGEGEQYRHDWKLPVPTQDRNMLFGLIRLHLERTTFSAPIRKLTVEVVPVKPRLAQGNLFAPPSPEPEKLEITLERIRGVVGSTDESGTDCVGSPCLVDTHKPGSFKVQHFSSVGELSIGKSADSCQTMAHIIALRVFRPAIETSVELDGEKPHLVWLWQRHRRVLAASGPWCTSGNWWNAFAWLHEEWDVALKTPAGLGYYRIYRDRRRKQWFVEGVFD